MIAQPQALPAVVQGPGEGPQHPADSGRCLERIRIRRHHQVPAALKHRSAGKIEVDSPRQPPTRKIHVHRVLVVEFDELQTRVIRPGRVIVNLVEDHDAVVGMQGRDRDGDRQEN